MAKKNEEFRSETENLFRQAFTDAAVEKVMAVLIGKHDAGQRTAYTYKGRKFEIVFKEIKEQSKENDLKALDQWCIKCNFGSCSANSKACTGCIIGEPPTHFKPKE